MPDQDDTIRMTPGASVYPARPADSRAVYLEPPAFDVAGDGVRDDAPAIQAAIDRVQETTRHGVIFVPPGVYRLCGTVNLWRGIRLIGFGNTRPRFLLDTDTPGFTGDESRYLIHFRDARPAPGQAPPDAKNTTFYSGISNIDFEIRPGNPAAVAVRFHVAQLCSLSHIELNLNEARAGVEAIGNQIESCRFLGGRFGILTHGGTSAGWQSLLIDCVFDRQAEACIESDRAGLTIIRCTMRRAPRGIVVPTGMVEQIVLDDCTFEDIPKAAVSLGEPNSPATQLNADRITCVNVPTFLALAGGPAVVGQWATYSLTDLSHGLHIQRNSCGEWGERTYTEAEQSPPPLIAAADGKPQLPPQVTWANLRDLGAVGDGQTDDTVAIRRAIEANRAIYVPMGRYRISDTIALGPDTVLLGLHPEQTQFVLASGSRRFSNPEAPRAMLLAPRGAETHVMGLGFDTGRNPGAVAVQWMAGQRSSLSDIWFDWGGHGADRKGEDALYSLWVTQGGGGTFRNIWSPSILARLGFYVSDTAAPGTVYLMSVEHHRDAEVRLERVANWRLFALQTEENLGSENATAIELRHCDRIELSNLFMYRVMAMTRPHPHAVHALNCREIIFCGVHSFSWGQHPFDSTIWWQDAAVRIKQRDFARMEV